MKFSRACKALAWTLSIALAVLSAGCLEGDKSIQARYDAQTDTFTYLVVYQHIRSSQPIGLMPGSTQPATDPAAISAFEHDFTNLSALYDNRDYLIFLPPMPPLDVLGETAAIKLPDNTIGNVSLGDAQGINAEKSPVPLDQVKVTPGSLFLAGKENLTYYHQITVPGKVVDQLLSYLQEQMAQPTLDGIDTELARRKNGGATVSWADVTAKLVDSINGKDPASQPAADQTSPDATQPATDAADNPQMPLSDESLNKIKAAIESRQPLVRRQGQIFFVRVPLSEADVTALLVMADQARQALAAQKTPGLDAVQIKAIDKTTVELSLDAVKWLNETNKMEAEAPLNDPKEATAATEMATLAPDRLPLAKDLTLQQVLDQFHAGAIKANPSVPPITPGTGLGSINPIAPATMP